MNTPKNPLDVEIFATAASRGKFVVWSCFEGVPLHRETFDLNSGRERDKFIAETIEALPDLGDQEKEFRTDFKIRLLKCAAIPPGPGESEEKQSQEDNRIQIPLSDREGEVARKCIAALAERDATIYQNSNRLVTVVREHSPEPRPSSIVPISAADIRTRITDVAVLLGGQTGRPVNPPAWLAPAVKDANEWKGIRVLLGATSSPILRRDGSIHQTRGYDARTCLLYEPTETFPTVPTQPTQDDAVKALTLLKNGVREFPFQDGSDRSAWLAEVLTLCARSAIDGPVPGFFHTANVASSGKTTLVKAAHRIATGYDIPNRSYPVKGRKNDQYEDIEEIRKQSVSCAMEGHVGYLFDNVPSGFSFGSGTMDAILTATVEAGRGLMTNDSPARPARTVWFWSGNNINPIADTVRRVIPIRLYSREENPSERVYELDVEEWAKRSRCELFVAALTIIAAYIQAGKPPVGIKPMGSFQAWSDLIRSALIWAGEPDPRTAQREFNEEDADRSDAIKLMNFLELVGATGSNPMTALKMAEATQEEMRQACPNESTPNIAGVSSTYSKVAAYRAVLPTSKYPNSHALAAVLKKHKGRNIDGKQITVPRRARDNTSMWAVERVQGGCQMQEMDSASTGGTSCNATLFPDSGCSSVQEVQEQNQHIQSASTHSTTTHTLGTRDARTYVGGVGDFAPAPPAPPAVEDSNSTEGISTDEHTDLADYESY